LKTTFQLSGIDEVAKILLASVPNKTVCLYGEMGAGKTTLVKHLIQELGAVDVANSPTFGLVNEYADKNGNPLAYHFDFYRLNDEMEALDMGFEDYLNSDAWLFIEWPEKIKSLLPNDAVSVLLRFIDENTRSIELNTS